MAENLITRPADTEYDAYYETYVSKVGPGPILETLQTQHEELQQRLLGISDAEADFRYVPDKWTIKEVVGHLVDSERVFLYRALCFARGETQPLPGMDQDLFVAGGEFAARSLFELLAEARLARRSTSDFFAGLSALQLERTGTASGYPFTTRSLAYIIAGHERHHLDILESRYGLPALAPSSIPS